MNASVDSRKRIQEDSDQVIDELKAHVARGDFLCVIKAPPGSGKTYTLLEAIGENSRSRTPWANIHRDHDVKGDRLILNGVVIDDGHDILHIDTFVQLGLLVKVNQANSLSFNRFNHFR